MPVHDWTRVDAGIFHDFHVSWIAKIQAVRNAGLLPEGHYALIEQHAGRSIADVLTLHASPAALPPALPPLPPDTAGILGAEVPPRARRKQIVELAALTRRCSVAVRHVSGHRLDSTRGSSATSRCPGGIPSWRVAGQQEAWTVAGRATLDHLINGGGG